jgi:uncharacterized membrane protein YfcA
MGPLLHRVRRAVDRGWHSSAPSANRGRMHILLALLVGLAGGGLGGLVGLGGGFVMVPLLIYLFRMAQHEAQGTSLAILLLPVGILSVIPYWRAGHVRLDVAAWAALGFLIGGFAGGTLAQMIGDRVLRRVFAVLMMGVAVDLLRR